MGVLLCYRYDPSRGHWKWAENIETACGYEGAIIYLEIGPITFLQVMCTGVCIFDVYLTCTSGSFNNSVSEMVWLSALISLLLGCSLGFQPVSLYVFEALNRLLLPLWRITPNWTNACWKRKKRDASWPRSWKERKKRDKIILTSRNCLSNVLICWVVIDHSCLVGLPNGWAPKLQLLLALGGAVDWDVLLRHINLTDGLCRPGTVSSNCFSH